MQLKRYTFLFCFAFLLSGAVIAQDFHYTQYFNSPLGVNPALAGSFNGTYRINGIYRDQYRGSAGTPFGGFSLNVDAPIVRGIRKQDWVGVGLRMEQNTSGSLEQKLNYYALGASYHLSLDKKQTSILAIGAQYGTGGYSYGIPGADAFASGILGDISEQAQTFQMGTSGGGNNPSIDGGSLNDLTVGAVYNARNPKTGGDFKIGLGVEGILNPNRAKRGQDGKGIGLNVFSMYEYVLSKRTSFSNGAYYYSNKQASALIVNSIANYKLKPENEMTLHGGLGVRNIRAALLYMGMTYKGVRVGLAYDLDIGASTPATSGHKSLELGVSYTGIVYKKPKPKPIIYCPRL